VDEVIVFDDSGQSITSAGDPLAGEFRGASNKGSGDSSVFLGRLLQYLETPQYLRKALFPIHKDLKYAGLLNPLDCPHHLRQFEKSKWREGLTIDTTNSKTRVDCGLQKVTCVWTTIDA
jgi:hypothetical protein